MHIEICWVFSVNDKETIMSPNQPMQPLLIVLQSHDEIFPIPRADESRHQSMTFSWKAS